MNTKAKFSAVGQKLLWFFSDANRVIATFTVALAFIGLCALRPIRKGGSYVLIWS